MYRLCLPLNLAREVLTVMHQYNGAHMSTDNLRIKFESNFWCNGIENALQSIKSSCLFCRLNNSRHEIAVKGTQRRHQNDLTPGRIWQADILYMPPNIEEHKYILTLA